MNPWDKLPMADAAAPPSKKNPWDHLPSADAGVTEQVAPAVDVSSPDYDLPPLERDTRPMQGPVPMSMAPPAEDWGDARPKSSQPDFVGDYVQENALKKPEPEPSRWDSLVNGFTGGIAPYADAAFEAAQNNPRGMLQTAKPYEGDTGSEGGTGSSPEFEAKQQAEQVAAQQEYNADFRRYLKQTHPQYNKSSEEFWGWNLVGGVLTPIAATKTVKGGMLLNSLLSGLGGALAADPNDKEAQKKGAAAGALTGMALGGLVGAATSKRGLGLLKKAATWGTTDIATGKYAPKSVVMPAQTVDAVIQELAVAPAQVVKNISEIKSPSFVGIRSSEDGREIMGYIKEAHGDGTIKIYEAPIDTPEKAALFGNANKKAGGQVFAHDPEGLFDKLSDEAQFAFAMGEKKNLPLDDWKGAPRGKGMKNDPTADTMPPSTPISIADDLPPSLGARQKPAMLVQDANGTIHFEDIPNDTVPSGRPVVGTRSEIFADNLLKKAMRNPLADAELGSVVAVRDGDDVIYGMVMDKDGHELIIGPMDKDIPLVSVQNRRKVSLKDVIETNPDYDQFELGDRLASEYIGKLGPKLGKEYNLYSRLQNNIGRMVTPELNGLIKPRDVNFDTVRMTEPVTVRIQGDPTLQGLPVPNDTVNGRRPPVIDAPPPPPPMGPEPVPDLGGGGSGGPPKPPAPGEPPAPPPAPVPPEEERVRGLLARLWAKGKQPFKTIQRNVVGQQARGEMDLSTYASDMANAKTFENNRAGYFKSMEKKLGSSNYRKFRADLMDFFEGRISMKQMETLHDSMSMELRERVGQLEARRDYNEARIAALGGLPEDHRMNADQMLKYVTREYAAKNMEAGQWLKVVQKDKKVWDDAVRGVKEWFNDATDTDAINRIEKMLGEEDPYGAFANGVKNGGNQKAMNNLKARNNELPDWYRKLLGENRDGVLGIATTLSKQEAIIARLEMFDALSKDPVNALRENAPLGWKPLDNDPKRFGRAAGMFLHPDAWDALVTIPNLKNTTGPVMRTLLGITKTNQVAFAPLRTFINMWMDNTQAGMLSGGFDPLTRLPSSIKAMKQAASAMYHYSKDSLKGNTLIDEARRMGIDSPGHIGQDLKDVNAAQLNKVFYKLGAEASDYNGFLKNAWEAYQRAGAKGGMAVDAIDRIHKISSYIMIRDKYLAMEPAKLAEMYGQTNAKLLPDEMARRLAARRIMEWYPMYDRVAPWTEKLRSTALGLGSPYSTFAMERMRILGTIPEKLVRDPELKWRMAKYAMVGGGLFGLNGLARNYAGEVSDEDIEAVMAARRGTGQEQANPYPWVLPVRIGGKVIVMDLTPWNSFTPMAQGDPNLPLAARVMLNVGTSPFKGGAVGEAVDAFSGAAGVKPMFRSPEAMPEAAGAQGVGELAARVGMVPRVMTDTYSNLKSTGMMGGLGMRREEQPLGVGLGRTAFPIERGIDPQMKGPKTAIFGAKKSKMSSTMDAMRILERSAMMKTEDAEPFIRDVLQWTEIDETPEKLHVRKIALDLMKKRIEEFRKSNAAFKKAKEQK